MAKLNRITMCSNANTHKRQSIQNGGQTSYGIRCLMLTRQGKPPKICTPHENVRVRNDYIYGTFNQQLTAGLGVLLSGEGLAADQMRVGDWWYI